MPTTLHELIARPFGLDLACRVDFPVDLSGIHEDFERVAKHFQPTSHPALEYNPHGGWHTLNLRSPNGHLTATLTTEGDAMRDTEAMEFAPNTRKLLDELGGRAGRVRLMSLEPGKTIAWHYVTSSSEPLHST